MTTSLSLQDFARRCPLVTMSSPQQFLRPQGTWPLTQAGSRTHQVETACSLSPARYFYTGRAYPAFGNAGFLYAPSCEQIRQGSTNPFDTGGVFRQHIRPGPISPPACNSGPRHVTLIQDTQSDLACWRGDFASYLSLTTINIDDYLRGDKPANTTWGPSDLPLHHPDNTDWRGWTWEVRIHNEMPYHQHLLFWACTEEAWLDIERHGTQNDDALGTLNAYLNIHHEIFNNSQQVVEALHTQVNEFMRQP